MNHMEMPKPGFTSEEGKKDRDSGSLHIAWHPAFVVALQQELECYGDSLEFFAEYQLSAEPLRIDCLVIKKVRDVVIKKNKGLQG